MELTNYARGDVTSSTVLARAHVRPPLRDVETTIAELTAVLQVPLRARAVPLSWLLSGDRRC